MSWRIYFNGKYQWTSMEYNLVKVLEQLIDDYEENEDGYEEVSSIEVRWHK